MLERNDGAAFSTVAHPDLLAKTPCEGFGESMNDLMTKRSAQLPFGVISMVRHFLANLSATILLTICLQAWGTNLIFADNWPAWRGATGQGLCSETDLPTRWSTEEHVKWKVALPAAGNSTPIVWNERVFLTQATDKGTKRWTHCFHRSDGRELWKRMVPYNAAEPTHDGNPYCSASPVTDGEVVIVSHGSAGVYCYDLDGDERWHRDLGTFHHVWGNAASPMIEGEVCIVNCGPGERTFLIALEKTTGEKVWKMDVPGGLADGDSSTWTGSWSTPVIAAVGGERLLFMSYPGVLYVLRPQSGEEVWRSEGLGKLVYTSPLISDGVAVSMSGYKGPLMGVRVGGTGDVTASHRLWHFERGPQRIGSGVIHDGHIYVVNDSGVAECLKLSTGKRVWRERLGAKSWSSVVLAGDRLYTADQEGNVFVVRAAKEKSEVVARNALGERMRASVAVSNGELFLRTYRHLWCIAETDRDR